MLANRGDHVFMVVNAACKSADIARLKAALEPSLTVTELASGPARPRRRKCAVQA